MKQTHIRRIIILAILLIVMVCSLFFNRPKPLINRETAFPLPKWHTNMRIKLVARRSQKDLSETMRLSYLQIEEMDAVINEYRKDSEAGRLRYQKTAILSAELFYLLEYAQEVSQKTQGAFDITVGPLVKLWKNCRKEKRLPASEELEQIRPIVGWKHIQLIKEQRKIEFSVPGISIELGGISKGYAVDRLVEFIKKRDIEAGLVDIGGEIKVFGDRFWPIGIQNPMVKNEKEVLPPIAVISIKNKAVATSGHYFRYYEIGGKKYSHIMDPRDYSPVPWRVISATVICEKAIEADAYATAACVLSIRESLELARKHNFELFIISQGDHGLEFHTTEGFDKYWKKRPNNE